MPPSLRHQVQEQGSSGRFFVTGRWAKGLVHWGDHGDLRTYLRCKDLYMAYMWMSEEPVYARNRDEIPNNLAETLGTELDICRLFTFFYPKTPSVRRESLVLVVWSL